MKRRAVFLDRDGVLNRAFLRHGKPHPPATLEEFELLPGVPEACKLLKEAGFLLVVATNQPDVGRGMQEQSVVDEMHRRLCLDLPIDRVEVCYDPGRGEHSDFRKPAPGMLLRAARDLNIDLASSFMIGDRWSDICCAHAAGCFSVFVDYYYNEEMLQQPNARVSSTIEAARTILQQSLIS